MADHGRYDTGERRPRGEERRGGMFGSGGSWFGPDPGEGRTRPDHRGGWYGEGRSSGGEGWGTDRARGASRERGRDYGYDDRHQGLPIDETSRLIASNKVEGTPVYSRDRHRLGSIYNFMVDKVSGQAEYAVLRYGGFLGMGQRYYPLPWRVLTYHRDAGGYVIDMLARDFEDAPSFDRDSEPEFDTAYGRKVHSWYGLDY
ncbi:MAG TPA: PRC-barrel domain-containing protein [Allosphingosinicella sp.]|jgi:hypothetical protein